MLCGISGQAVTQFFQKYDLRLCRLQKREEISLLDSLGKNVTFDSVKCVVNRVYFF